ncbi:MAG: adenylate kinase [Janthinobacterium lividum]
MVLIGPPGSGKGTQGQFLAGQLGLPHVSIGDVFREVSNGSDSIGKLLKEYMTQGNLVPSQIADGIIKNFLSSEKYKAGYILDGYPRNVAQAQFLDSISDQVKNVIYFEINKELALKRILGRFSCKNCNKSFNSNFDGPPGNNACNNCGSSDFFLRTDDSKNIIEKRIKVYNEQTYPLIKYYENIRSNFYTVDAGVSKEEVTLQLLNILKKI